MNQEDINKTVVSILDKNRGLSPKELANLVNETLVKLIGEDWTNDPVIYLGVMETLIGSKLK